MSSCVRIKVGREEIPLQIQIPSKEQEFKFLLEYCKEESGKTLQFNREAA